MIRPVLESVAAEAVDEQTDRADDVRRCCDGERGSSVETEAFADDGEEVCYCSGDESELESEAEKPGLGLGRQREEGEGLTSARAIFNARPIGTVSFSSLVPRSTSSLHMSMSRSTGVTQRTVSGRLGRMNAQMTATGSVSRRTPEVEVEVEVTHRRKSWLPQR